MARQIPGTTKATPMSTAMVRQASGEDRQVLVDQYGKEFGANTWQSPGAPDAAMPPPPGWDVDEWSPRQFAYVGGRNIIRTPRGDERNKSSFALLRELADSYDVARICIDFVKDTVASTEWDIVPRRGMTRDKTAPATDDGLIPQMKDRIQSPDREHEIDQWIKMALEEVLVCDALAIYARPTVGGLPYSYEVIAGDTIKPLVDALGRTPFAPAPAYQQILYGQIYGNYSRDQLHYLPMNPRASSAYGFSPLERFLMSISTALRKQIFELKWFTEGNTPDALLGFSMGNATPAQTRQFQAFIDNRLKGDDGNRRGITVVPIPTGDAAGGKMDIVHFQEPVWERVLEQWMTQIACAALYTTPSEIGFLHQTNRSTSQSQENTQERRLRPLYRHIKGVINRLMVWGEFGATDKEFRWMIEGPVEDELKQATIDDIRIKNGTRSVDELRERDGLEGFGLDRPFFVAQSQILMADDVAKFSEEATKPPPEPVPPFGGNGSPSANGDGDGSKPPFGGAGGSRPTSAGSASPAAGGLKKIEAETELAALNRLLKKGARRAFVPEHLPEGLVKAIEAHPDRAVAVAGARVLLGRD